MASTALGREVTRYLVAQQFLTRLPSPVELTYEPGALARAARYFPAVGLLIGGLSALVWLGLSMLTPPTIAAGGAIAVMIMLTGALHEDGFADCCDGLGGGASRERALEIMRDSRIGAYGAIGLVMVIGLRWSGLAAFDATSGAMALLIAPVLGRGAMTLMLRLGDYAREDGAARDVKDGVSDGEVLFSSFTCLAVAIAFGGIAGALAAAGGLIACFVWLAWLKRKLGGYTGDGLGACEQIVQVITLATLAAFWS